MCMFQLLHLKKCACARALFERSTCSLLAVHARILFTVRVCAITLQHSLQLALMPYVCNQLTCLTMTQDLT